MLEKLNFNDLLRYGFSGGTFLIAMALARFGFDSVVYGGCGWAESPVLALVAVIVGSLIYALHCAFFQSHVTFFITWLHDRKRPAYKFSKYFFTMFRYDLLITKNFKRDYRRWERRCNYAKFQESFDKWASQVHFLYGCFWAISIGAVGGRCLSHVFRGHVWYYFFTAGGERKEFCLLIIVAVLSLFGALIQDYALYYYDKKLMADYHSEPKIGVESEDSV